MGLPTSLAEHRLSTSVSPDPDDVVSPISWIESHPVVTVPIAALVFADSPRLGGQDEEHIRVLAESHYPLPAITVHGPTMRVIDGTHRVHAALLNERSTIQARVLDCDEHAAFVLAVTTNVTHGLPLSKSDRAAAAARIIASNPQWSDRAVAAATALSDKTVSAIRARSTSDGTQLDARVGRDGRVRPLDSGDRRKEAAALLRARPGLGLRKVARATGLSPATVRDVRQRMDRGEDPVPNRYRTVIIAEAGNGAQTEMAAAEPAAEPGLTPIAIRHGARASQPEFALDSQVLLDKLTHDPSLRHSEAGRQALRFLRQHVVGAGGLEGLARGLPDHCAPVVAELALSCAAA